MPYCCSDKLLRHPSHLLRGKSLKYPFRERWWWVFRTPLPPFLFLWPAVTLASPCWQPAKSLNHWIGGRVFERFPKSINLFLASLFSLLPSLTYLPALSSPKLVTSFPLSCTHNLSPVPINPHQIFFQSLVVSSKVTSVHMKCAKNESALTLVFLLVELNTLFFQMALLVLWYVQCIWCDLLIAGMCAGVICTQVCLYSEIMISSTTSWADLFKLFSSLLFITTWENGMWACRGSFVRLMSVV